MTASPAAARRARSHVRSLLLAVATTLTAACGPMPATSPATPGAPECKMGSNGQQTCGYNCKLGSAGSWFCASRPDGQCALNADGTWTCP